MTRYSHTQVGWLNLLSLALTGSVCLFMSATIPLPWMFISLGVALLMFALLFLFYAIRIEIEEETIQMTMGPGLVKKQWALADVVSAKAVRTRLIDGWGIKLTKEGWLYSVSIPHAVHITFKNGKGVLLGTDEPEELLEALAQAGIDVGRNERSSA